MNKAMHTYVPVNKTIVPLPGVIYGFKGLSGYSGRDFNVRNNDSEYGLSLLILGLLNEGMTPKPVVLPSWWHIS